MRKEELPRPRPARLSAREWLNCALALMLVLAPFVAYAALFG